MYLPSATEEQMTDVYINGEYLECNQRELRSLIVELALQDYHYDTFCNLGQRDRVHFTKF